MGVEAVRREILDPVIVEARRRIDQQAERRQPGRRRRRDNGIARARIGEIGRDHRGPAPCGRDLRRQRVGIAARGVAMDDDMPAVRRQRPHQRRADALGAAGDDRGAGSGGGGRKHGHGRQPLSGRHRKVTRRRMILRSHSVTLKTVYRYRTLLTLLLQAAEFDFRRGLGSGPIVAHRRKHGLGNIRTSGLPDAASAASPAAERKA